VEDIQEGIIKGKTKKFRVKIGPPKLTKYERARILGSRALQLSLGAPVLISLENIKTYSPLEIAKMEMEMKILPIIVRRKNPSGRYQDIPLKFLL